MKPHFKQIVTIILSVFLLSCSSSEESAPITTTPPVVTPPKTPEPPIASSINYLALGDSYTIGQSVCATCRFPEQLKTSLNAMYSSTISLKIIATTGWTTSNLLSAINTQNPEANYDLVTLLIGVNNQYQHRNFSVYEKEFPELVTKAIMLAKGDRKNVVVISIPDYAYTPYGKSLAGDQTSTISAEIDQYNSFAEKYCANNQVAFVSITDITRQGLNSPNLVASDGLHPSESAYKLFVDKMMPEVKKALQN
ncbi:MULTISPECIES: SGNH/GDSL hydrolase family protein [unclassified Flavobacterium]|jgi:acyl-CoA thioesterase-1|uniref:SGNH/GDSL hydrolase family protein n=1 Tax=unclassified Flavobacterium TaxID=196869 RepID=UPI001065C7D7|nr:MULTISPECIES: SGNH/GDSL hydrolase family protein [unclassified Flavobacterium]MDQ1163823.1 acyl-CoA thioesterase-1 [Flavobacterium sp. SORGH_AS_0622]TDX13745.1 lysophospholipase L1-like esterase [Flavobacterium sp. S87F.05.LMB.W.Kidney.N]